MERPRPSNNELVFSRAILQRGSEFNISYLQNIDTLKKFNKAMTARLGVLLRYYGQDPISWLQTPNLYLPSDYESTYIVEKPIGDGMILLTETDDSYYLSKWLKKEDYDLPDDTGTDETQPEIFYAPALNICSFKPPDIFINLHKTDDEIFSCSIKKDQFESYSPIQHPEDSTVLETYADTLQTLLHDLLSVTTYI